MNRSPKILESIIAFIVLAGWALSSYIYNSRDREYSILYFASISIPLLIAIFYIISRSNKEKSKLHKELTTTNSAWFAVPRFLNNHIKIFFTVATIIFLTALAIYVLTYIKL